MALRLTMQEPNANLASHRENVFASGQPKLRRGRASARPGHAEPRPLRLQYRERQAETWERRRRAPVFQASGKVPATNQVASGCVLDFEHISSGTAPIK